MSRIYWRDRKGRAQFLDYPLRGPDVMKKLGPVDLTKALFSYLWAAVKPKGKETTYEEWVANRFGRFYAGADAIEHGVSMLPPRQAKGAAA